MLNHIFIHMKITEITLVCSVTVPFTRSCFRLFHPEDGEGANWVLASGSRIAQGSFWYGDLKEQGIFLSMLEWFQVLTNNRTWNGVGGVVHLMRLKKSDETNVFSKPQRGVLHQLEWFMFRRFSVYLSWGVHETYGVR